MLIDVNSSSDDEDDDNDENDVSDKGDEDVPVITPPLITIVLLVGGVLWLLWTVNESDSVVTMFTGSFKLLLLLLCPFIGGWTEPEADGSI